MSTTGTVERFKLEEPVGGTVVGLGKAATCPATVGAPVGGAAGGGADGAMAGPEEVPGFGVNLRPVCSAVECIVAPLV